jgi:hypothetical protein
MTFDEVPPLPCADKIAFDSNKDAKAAANVAQYRYGTKLKTYQCRYCSLWHLSSQ